MYQNIIYAPLYTKFLRRVLDISLEACLEGFCDVAHSVWRVGSGESGERRVGSGVAC